MLELMNPVAIELGRARRQEVAEETMRAARWSEARSRRAARAALFVVTDTLGTADAPATARMQPTGDCIQGAARP